MNFLENKCTFSRLSKEVVDSSYSFDCGHEDLNDFFKNDSLNYEREFLGKSYCFFLDENPNEIICIFTVSNDSIKANFLPNARKKKVSKQMPREKHFRSYPAVLVGRLGVNQKYRNKGIGGKLMDFIKSWFIDTNNKTGCRFVVVDAYNEDAPIAYYQKNGFDFLFSTEEQEKEYTGLATDDSLATRLMYFDLIRLSTI